MSRLRSGLVVPMPELEAVVGDHRMEWDPVAELGARAHVTVLFPFAPPTTIGPPVLDRVDRALARRAPFTVTFSEFGRFPDDVLFLAPEPADAFRALTDALVAEFPEYPPYHGQYRTVVPHLTVAHHPDAPVDTIIRALTARLPVATAADAVELWVEGGDDQWRTTARWELSGDRT
jgi:2'-5' RNA ligase